jgi:hypothetical protein
MCTAVRQDAVPAWKLTGRVLIESVQRKGQFRSGRKYPHRDDRQRQDTDESSHKFQ